MFKPNLVKYKPLLKFILILGIFTSIFSFLILPIYSILKSFIECKEELMQTIHSEYDKQIYAELIQGDCGGATTAFFYKINLKKENTNT